jgi:hypothetical protein
MSVPAGSSTLMTFESGTAYEQGQTLGEVALPAGVVAHRLGDYVFTYHGIDPKTDDAGLWLVIASPDPGANGMLLQGEVFAYQAQLADGSVLTINAVDWPGALAGQNALRAQAGLAPIPDPQTVTHSAPAVGPVP